MQDKNSFEKKTRIIETRIRIGRKSLRSSSAISRKPPSGPFDLTRAPPARQKRKAIAKAPHHLHSYRDKHPQRRGARRDGEDTRSLNLILPLPHFHKSASSDPEWLILGGGDRKGDENANSDRASVVVPGRATRQRGKWMTSHPRDSAADRGTQSRIMSSGRGESRRRQSVCVH